jgi:hypothetical protein
MADRSWIEGVSAIDRPSKTKERGDVLKNQAQPHAAGCVQCLRPRDCLCKGRALRQSQEARARALSRDLAGEGALP